MRTPLRSVVVLSLVIFALAFARPALAADVADGTITMKIEPGAAKLCVVVPEDQLDPSCDPMIAARIGSMTEMVAKQQGSRVTFVASVVGADWLATATLMRTSEHGEMSSAAIQGLTRQFADDPETKATATETRVNGVQVVRVENHLSDDGGPGGVVITHVLAGKTNYVLTLAGPAAHQAELEAMAQGALASTKLEAAVKTEVKTTEESSATGLAVKIGIGVFVAVLVLLGLRVLITKDEEPPPMEEGDGKSKSKKKRKIRGGKR